MKISKDDGDISLKGNRFYYGPDHSDFENIHDKQTLSDVRLHQDITTIIF